MDFLGPAGSREELARRLIAIGIVDRSDARCRGREVTPEAQGTWLGCGAALAGVVVGRLAGAALGVWAGLVVFWPGMLLLLWRYDRHH